MSLDKKQLKSYYEKKARELDEFHLTYNHPSLYKRSFYATRFNKVISLLNPQKKEYILDVGCGSGIYAKGLLENGSRVAAVDLANDYLKQTKKLVGKNPDLELVVADATQLPFKKNTFDKVLFTEVIEHIPDYKNSLQEIKRVLKEGGVVVISTPSRFSPMNICYKLKRIVKGYKFNEHIHEFTPKEFQNEVSKFFVVEKLEFANFFFPYPIDSLLINIKSETFIRVVLQMEAIMQKLPIFKYLGWTIIIRAKKIQR